MHSNPGVKTASAFAAIFVLICAGTAGAALIEDLAPMPANLNLPTAAIVDDEFIYVATGWDLAIGWSTAMYVYSIEDDTWSTNVPAKAEALEPIPTPRTESCNTGMIDGYGKFCVIGGAEGTGMTYVGPTDVVECYDPAANAWSTIPQLPSVITGAYCTVYEGVIYVTGGYTGSVYNNDLWYFDTTTKPPTWQTAAASSSVDAYGGGGALTRDPAFVDDAEYRLSQFLGNSADSTHYGFTSGTWSAVSVFSDLIYPCVLPDGDYNTLIIGGGDFGAAPYPTSDEIVSYSSTTDEWTTASQKLPLSLAGMACTQDSEGNIYLFAGYSTDDDKDLKIVGRIRARLVRGHKVNNQAFPGGYMYLINSYFTWANMFVFMMLNPGAGPPPADLDVADNGTARIKFDEDITSLKIRIQISDSILGRSDSITMPFTTTPPADEDKNVFYEDWQSLRVGLNFRDDPLNLRSRWERDDYAEGPFQFGVRVQFKAEEEKLLEINDPDVPTSGELFSRVYPIPNGTFTYTWDAYFDSGDGMSFALYDQVGNTRNIAYYIHMTQGAVTVEDPATKAVVDCSAAINTGQWYNFAFEMDHATGQGTLSIDDTATDCAAVATPFDSQNPVQATGWVTHDDINGGITYIDNIEILGFETPPPGDDDDDDSDDDDSDDDDSDDDDDDDSDDDDDDDDDDSGCCG
jgi:N-acetylneuraminic acid mutarotase